jgi:hypothetical protein
LGAGLEVSGIESPQLAYILWVIAGILFVWGILPYVRGIKLFKRKKSPRKIEFRQRYCPYPKMGL